MTPRRGWVQRRMREVAIERAIERKRVRAAVPLLFAGLGPPRRPLNVKGMKPMSQQRRLMLVLNALSAGQESTFATKVEALLADCGRAGLEVEVRLSEAKVDPSPADYEIVVQRPLGSPETPSAAKPDAEVPGTLPKLPESPERAPGAGLGDL